MLLLCECKEHSKSCFFIRCESSKVCIALQNIAVFSFTMLESIFNISFIELTLGIEIEKSTIFETIL